MSNKTKTPPVQKNEVTMGSVLMTAELMQESTSAAQNSFVAAVAQALGWEVNDTDARAIKKGDMELYINTQNYGKSGLGHSEITCHYPRYRHGGYCEPCTRLSIGIGPTKTPDQWAKDITSRLLPDYRRVLDDVQARVKANAEKIDAVNARAAEFVAALGAGASPLHGENKQNYERSISLRLSKGFGNVRVNDTTAHIDVSSIPVDVAQKVLVYMASLLPKE